LLLYLLLKPLWQEKKPLWIWTIEVGLVEVQAVGLAFGSRLEMS
jgi:hypothetical protein